MDPFECCFRRWRFSPHMDDSFRSLGLYLQRWGCIFGWILGLPCWSREPDSVGCAGRPRTGSRAAVKVGAGRIKPRSPSGAGHMRGAHPESQVNVILPQQGPCLVCAPAPVTQPGCRMVPQPLGPGWGLDGLFGSGCKPGLVLFLAGSPIFTLISDRVSVF